MNFEYMKNFMDSLTEWIIPGNSVVIYKDGKKVFEYSSGYSDLEKKIKKTGEEQLYIYSCSKVATVTAALQLYEQGKFLLSDPLYEYLPEFKKMYVKDGDRIKAAEPGKLHFMRKQMSACILWMTRKSGAILPAESRWIRREAMEFRDRQLLL